MTSLRPKYEFGGPLGAAAIVLGLPVLLFVFHLTCNDVSGCPIPSLLSPTTFTWEDFTAQTPWPRDGFQSLFSWEATGWLLAYYLVSMTLHRVLPAQEVYGSKLRDSGLPLKYRFNAFSATVIQLSLCAIGTYFRGADFIVWTYVTDNYLQLLTSSTILAFGISMFVYVLSFQVKPGNSNLRELARGGRTGNFVYDFYIGRELNPRLTLPFFGEIDLKTWLEMRPGLTGWIILDLAFVAKQYRDYGYLSDSIILTSTLQAYYVLESHYLEANILSMMDIIADGLGFMLTFGDIVWVPFLYSTQCRYLATYPLHLGYVNLTAFGAIFTIGAYIFRASNDQKNLFRSNPNHPSVSGITYLQTKRGTRLLTGGWWGISRHMNYLGDWLHTLPFCLPTLMAGYLILPAGTPTDTVSIEMLDGKQVVQGDAKGWGMVYTYFYAIYFAVLLVHRENRDDVACAEKYGKDWDRYKEIVRWRIVPGLY
ncbi:Delta(14)-sterol reductase [Pestalotiopsis fici W106-1]|uniref:Delta(14)-sterol reductase n=1 Tax=Pestalotiopsis fici (strain W106-1 / CGMCC3.15140) TaxID=1229662 RepID=W3WYC7_PESFW|nr:Delta(14)-sterol reductase [Pestalotiopsis fici W106-1]ETS78137.1 Delta(14)-sterol reductase [Pestalotiopsis fici W106-1]